MVKIIFFQAHPDDLEFNCAHLIHYLTKKSKYKNIIKIASITKGEFGLPGAKYDKFKGMFLAKVRTRELYNAQSIHGISPKNIDFFGYIDGFVKFNKEFVDKIADYIRKEKPDLIFAPEPIYTWYYHMDHINTGRAIFYIIYNKLIDFIPILYFYSSLSPNLFFPFKKEDIGLVKQLLACHRTQYWLINYMMFIYKPIMRLAGRKVNDWKYAEPYRRIYFSRANKKRHKISLKTRIFSHFFSSLPFYKAKYPQEILNKLKKEKKQK